MSQNDKQQKPKPNKVKGEKKATKSTKQRRDAEPVDDRPIWEQYGLNLQQETFCQYYTSPSEYFGNGTQSYIQAYDIDISNGGNYMSAAASATRLLKDVKICKRINDLLSELGLNDMFVDKQLTFLIAQHSDNSAKLGAIREYNKMKQRVTEKHEHTVFTPVTKIIINKPEDNNNGNTDAGQTSDGETGEGNQLQSDTETDAGTGTA